MTISIIDQVNIFNLRFVSLPLIDLNFTGIYDIFNYRDDEDNIQQYYPIQIGTTKQESDCFVNSFSASQTPLGLIFIMPKAQKLRGTKEQRISEHIIWQYTIETYNDANQNIHCHRGYFKLHEDYRTKVHLKSTNIIPANITWIRIQAYDVRNPHRRAWFQPIKGPKFSSKIISLIPQGNKC